MWAPVFIFFTVINCKIPLCSFNNTFNSWLTFIDPPTYPHPDLTPEWTPTFPTPTFFSFIISSIRSSHPPDTTQSLSRLFNFTIASIIGSPDPTPTRPRPDPHYSEKDFHKGYLFRRAHRF